MVGDFEVGGVEREAADPIRSEHFQEGRAVNPTLNVDESVLVDFCTRHDIRRLSLFGSRLAGAERPGSDIDLLVEFEPGKVPGLLAVASMEAELSELLGGRPVDLRTPRDLSRYFREEVIRSAEVQYAR